MSVDQLVGQELGQYTLTALLGGGGMGAVYRARQASLDRDVAVKVLPRDLAEQPGYLERFEREARIAASLEHRHIVPVYDFGVQGDLSYVVMRLLTGGTLADWLRQAEKGTRPRPTMAQIGQIVRQMADALDYAHGRGVIHRDVKPGNIMFDDQGSAYLVDFGIARLARPDTPTTGKDLIPTLGTPAYMPPEQWRSETLTPAADQYALAVVAFVLLAGKLPFEADTIYQMMHRHLNEAPPPLEFYRSDLPPSLSPVLQRALSKEPEHRFPSVTVFADSFEKAIDGADDSETDAALASFSPQALSDTTPHLRVVRQQTLPRPAILVGALIGLLALAAIVAFGLLQPGKTVEQVDTISTPNPLPTRTEIGVASPISVAGQPTQVSVTSVALTLTALYANAPTQVAQPTAAPILPTPLPGQSDSAIGPVDAPTALPISSVQSVTEPTTIPSDLPNGYLRDDLMGQIFRLSPDGIPFVYAFTPPDFTGSEPYLTINVDNYPARYHPDPNAVPIGYLTKGQSYPVLRAYNGYVFVRGSKFGGWIVLDPSAMTVHGDIDVTAGATG